MACNPPYCLGTGGFCNCNCYCCPPTPCYTSWTYTYLCGTSSGYWDANVTPDESCDCSPMPFRAPSLNVEFPQFEYPQVLTDDGYVFALDVASCSIPCTTYTITLTTTGCCLYPYWNNVYGNGLIFTAIGAGNISLSGCGSACSGSFQCKINNNTGTVTVADCGQVIVEITPPAASCCTCCLVSSSGTLLNPSSPFRKRTVGGKQKFYVDPKKLVNKIKKTKPSS